MVRMTASTSRGPEGEVEGRSVNPVCENTHAKD